MEQIDKEPQSATDVLASLQDEVKDDAGTAPTAGAPEAPTTAAEGAASTDAPLDGATAAPPELSPATAGAAAAQAAQESATANSDSAETKSGSATDGLSADGAGPFVGAEALLTALKVVRRAAPKKEKDQPSLAFVVVDADPEHSRLVVAARDGHRWHVAYVPVSQKLRFRTLAINLETVKRLITALDGAVKLFPGGANVRFRPDTGSDLRWAIAFGEDEPMQIELKEFDPGRAPVDWQPPTFRGPDAGKTVLARFDAKIVSQATTWPGGGAIISRDEVDGAGRRHVTLTSDSGDELLRAVLVCRGLTEGLPKDAQTEIPGTRTPVDAPKKSRARKKDAATPPLPGIAAGPAVQLDPKGRWRVERRNTLTGKYDTVFPGTEDEARKYYDANSDDPHPMRVVKPDGSVALTRPGKAGGPAVAVRKPRGAAVKAGAKVVPISSAKRAGAKSASANSASAGKAPKKTGAKKAAPKKGSKRR